MKSFPKWTNQAPQTKGTLSPLHQRFLKSFFALAGAEDFYLAGGTALAEFYLAHRKSYDFDFFTGLEGVIIPFANKLEQHFKGSFSVTITRRHETFVELELKETDQTIKIQLAYDSPFRFQPPLKVETIIVNDYLDLIADKFGAFFGRTAPKDVVDLYFILTQENASFWELAEFAKEKDPGFDLYFFVQALHKARSNSDRAEDWPLQMLKPFDPRVLKNFFQNLSLEIEKKLAENK